ncbi:MAG: aminotransferase class V-fold PLP-dependent enzyme [Polyangiaceae bacterium]|nr:aminotransferase class V-fold PLP-dependent enzyme [Polyangiaceae bacterium]
MSTHGGETAAAFAELDRAVRAALETYSNVHRGSGHASVATTRLYERARGLVLEHLGLDRGHVVVFCAPARAAALTRDLDPGSYRVVSSEELGLPLGVRAVAVRKRALPRGAPHEPGGGTARLVAREWVVWAGAPDRFEPGTPAVVNVVAFAQALRMVQRSGPDLFRQPALPEAPRGDGLEHLVGAELLGELRKTRLGAGLRVPTAEGERRYVHLDYAASAPTFAPIADAFLRALRLPASARDEVVRATRAICAEAMGAPVADHDVVFTANTTEAIHLVAEAMGRAVDPGIDPVVVTTLLEHTSNDLPWRGLPRGSVVRLSIDEEGFVDPKELEAILGAHHEGRHGRRRVVLVAVSGASNVLGSCNDLAQIARLAHQYGARLLVDAAQLVAHRPVTMAASGIDYLAFSAHKIYAPFGCGALVARRELLQLDADGEAIRASGEENVAGIAALGEALSLLGRIGMDVVEAEERALTTRALHGMAGIPGLQIYGVQDPAAARFSQKVGVIAFALKGMMADRVAQELALRAGIGIRAGCHCAHLVVKQLVGIGPFLERFQRAIVTLFPRLQLPGVARVSLGLGSTVEDVDLLVHALAELALRPRKTRADVRRGMDSFAEAVAQRTYALPLR